MEYKESPETNQCIEGALENDRDDMQGNKERREYSVNRGGEKWLSK